MAIQIEAIYSYFVSVVLGATKLYWADFATSRENNESTLEWLKRKGRYHWKSSTHHQAGCSINIFLQYFLAGKKNS